MSYRSILVHACQAGKARSRYRLAAAIARAEEAQLAGIAPSGMTELAYRCGAAAAIGSVDAGDLSFLAENARRELAAFEAEAAHAGVAPVAGQLSDDSAARALPLAARCCDLLVIGQENSPDEVFADDHSLARTVLVHAPCPVLVVPGVATADALPQRPLIAWDGSMEASRAVRAALPLLRRAGKATAITFPPEKFHTDDGKAGACLAAYLHCHGIDVALVESAHAASVGHALLSFARERSHDLIVMGCFGHSRFREIVLGGVTHTVLSASTVPILMCH